MVERSIAWLTRGNRPVPYRGIEKNNNWLHHRAAGLNLRRLLAMGLIEAAVLHLQGETCVIGVKSLDANVSHRLALETNEGAIHA